VRKEISANVLRVEGQVSDTALEAIARLLVDYAISEGDTLVPFITLAMVRRGRLEKPTVLFIRQAS
jgi:hypothetical protein